ncbi:ankyrin repeat-containing domain protein [Gautieria morchelliformis]|nr:ankyrin repeat-containing domain protein [Gautieria morchelliformis]
MAAALGLTASVIAVLNLTMATISTCYSYGSGVKNASKDKKKIIDQLRGLQSVLEGVRALVEDEELKASSRLPAVLELLNDSSNGLSRCHAELAALKTKLEPKARHTDRIQALIWPFKEGEVKKTLHHLGQFQQRLDSTLSVDQTYCRGCVAILLSPGNMLTCCVEERRQEIYTWLSTHDYQSKHTNAYKERQETTGSWFLQGRPFEEWKCRDNSFLWLHGIRAFSIALLELFCHCKSHASFVTAYFYFDFHDKDTRPEVALGSLVEQLSMQCGSFPDALTQLFSENGKNRAPPPQHLMAVLKAVIGSFRNVYIVFDALDECPQRAELLNLLREINDWGLGTLHLLVTSRRERDLEEALDSFVSHHVPLEQRVVDHDIRVHVSKTLDRDIKFKRYSTEDKKMIESTLTEGAHGMFRLVACQLDVLRKCYSPAELMKALNSLPRTLYETYDRMLSSIPEEHRRDTLRVLQWLAFSVRTISLQEAVEVLATDPDEEDGPLFDVRGRLWDPRNIVAICSSLITIAVPAVNTHAREGRIGRASTAGLEELKLAHFSVREYLVSEHLRKSDVALSWFHFNKRIADTYIAKTCLAYLLQFTDHKWVPLKTAKTSPLSAYAARHWIVHAQSDTDGASESLHRLMMALLQPKDAVYKNWLQLYNGDPSGAPITASRETCPPLASRCLLESGALQVAAFKGRYAIVRLLLEKGAEINPQGGGLDENDFWFPKTRDDSYAMIIQLLLEKGGRGHSGIGADHGRHDAIVPDVDAKGGRGHSGIGADAASFKGHSGIRAGAASLQGHQKGADPSAQGGAASFGGHDAIVRLLLENGADAASSRGHSGIGADVNAASSGAHEGIVHVNIPGIMLDNALTAASLKGNDVIGANVNVQGWYCGSALHAASSVGHDTIVRLLLEEGADAASSKGYDVIVRLLLENGADCAVLKGHYGIAQFLLEEDADVNFQGGYYSSVLEAASTVGHKNIGADDSALQAASSCADNGSALQAAAYKGDEGIVRLLLEEGADHGRHEEIGADVQAYKGCDAVVHTLLDAGADYGTALQAASLEGHDKIGADAAAVKGHDVIVRLLLERGADVNLQGGYYGNAFQAAVIASHDGILEVLLEKGHFGSALQAALYRGYFAEREVDANKHGGFYGSGQDEDVRLLLEMGADAASFYGRADVNYKGGHYGNPSPYGVALFNMPLMNEAEATEPAAVGARAAIVHLLLENGADVNLQGGPFGSALQAASSYGHINIVRTLLDNGADVTAKGGLYGSALLAALTEDNTDIIRLLVYGQ